MQCDGPVGIAGCGGGERGAEGGYTLPCYNLLLLLLLFSTPRTTLYPPVPKPELDPPTPCQGNFRCAVGLKGSRGGGGISSPQTTLTPNSNLDQPLDLITLVKGFFLYQISFAPDRWGNKFAGLKLGNRSKTVKIFRNNP